MLLIVDVNNTALDAVHLGTVTIYGHIQGYTDFGLMTADSAFTEDVHKLFMQLTGLGGIVLKVIAIAVHASAKITELLWMR